MTIKIQSVFVDIDGVFADFAGRYKSLYGEKDHPSKNKEKEYNRNNFANFIETEQFKTVDAMPDIDIGLDILKIINGSINVSLLGSVGYIEAFEQVVSQKLYWLETHDINFPAILVPGKRYKRLWAGPGKLLIDDTLSNCEDWIKAGGIAIHHKNWTDTILRFEFWPHGVYYND
jgi:hypothetical protein